MNIRMVAGSVAVTVGLVGSLSAQKKTVPVTSWGEPDLQGTYTNQTLTPLERPATLGTKAFLTKEEAQALERQTEARRLANQDAAPRLGDVGTYNDFWTEPSTKVVG